MDGDDETTKRAIVAFVKTYNAKAAQASRAEAENNSIAANLHVELSALVSAFIDATGDRLNADDLRFLRGEVVARCMQGLVLRSMELSGFGDLALSLGASRKLKDDLQAARRRVEDSRAAGESSSSSSSATVDHSDPRVDTNGLYEYIPYERLDVSLSDLPGYEIQHRRVINAYFVLSSSTESSRDGGDDDLTVDGRKPRTLAGANVILYGPPGTGKTAAARAVARSLSLDLAFVNAENLLSAYRSETEKNLRELYAKMRALVRLTGRNVVLLLDEVDGLVKNRNAGQSVSSGEYSLLTSFLTTLEPNNGLDNRRIFSIFTTNVLSNLDPAFRRRCVTVLFGYINDANARVRLIDAFLRDEADPSTRSDDTMRNIVDVCEAWVPGDFARFKRETVAPLRLHVYLQSRDLTEEAFFAQHIRTGGGGQNTSREIIVALPLLSYDVLLAHMRDYRPITPLDKYGEYLDD